MVGRVLRGRPAFLAVAAVQRGIPFLLLPLFVRVLTPTEYGHVAVLAATMTLGSMTFGLGQELVAYRYLNDPQDGRRTVTSAALVQTAAPLGLAALTTGLLLVTGLDLGGTSRAAVTVTLFSAAVYCIAWQYPAALYRNDGHLGPFFGLAVLYSVLVAAAKVLFVVALDAGVLGWAAADLLGATALLACTATTLASTLRRVRSDTTSASVRRVLRLGVPVSISQFARWAAGFSDRIWIVVLVPPTSAAGYLIAAQLVTIGNVVAIELARFLQPQISRHQGALAELLRTVLPRHLAFSLLAAGAVAGIAAVFVQLGLAADYEGVAALSAVLSVGLFFQSLNYLGSDVSAIAVGNTNWLMAVSIGAGIAGTAGSFVLIGVLGVWGAVAAAVGTQVLTSVLLWVPIRRAAERSTVTA
ncbi:lipopolysaccharide biosynthesis protein [Nocardioides sp. Arc9.136]|uniref:lipopolysaccharide biosynthesis protein n=1 Tax=Nocardioides sp. Arc9.136 TaxID=2996826 RepID=UPI0026662DC0|nr:lipopolysaccharide biosynthesis protein [Nocardioides sp. Arc9.136]WKN50690.1 lipopolysaccharide biosynthesis protein [Nocardioides sp. Arc9.136]